MIIKITNKYDGFPKVREIQINEPNVYSMLIYVTTSPTSNCQLLSIGSFHYLLENNLKDDEFLKIIQTISERIYKTQFLIDIDQKLLPKLNKYIRRSPNLKSVMRRKYTSTNGSKMAICVFKLLKK